MHLTRFDMDIKTKNLIKFFILRIASVVGVVFGVVLTLVPDRDPLKIIGVLVLLVALWRISLSVYRRLILPPKLPTSYGKWAVVTGSTSGIGKAYAEHLARLGMNLLIISRDKLKLSEQTTELIALGKAKGGITVKFLSYDFTNMDQEIRKKFYEQVDEELMEMDSTGGVGVLVNNVGMANEIPRKLEEFTSEEVDNLITCNIFSTVDMTRAAMKYMKAKGSGAIISVSSGSGNHPGPFLAIYSATKAFMTQFSRSMHVECWDSGVDFLVVTPFYVVSNLYKRKTGSLVAPMPDKLVEGTFKQLGKTYIWQTHGYWFHGFIGNVATYFWGTTERYRNMMVNNRKRYDEKQASKFQKKK